MRLLTTVVLLALLVLASSASAEITLKKSFWKGWQFSLDGSKFEKVGLSGASLRKAMAGDDDAQALMDQYRRAKTWSFVTGFVGGALIGWPIGGYIGNSVWEDYYTPMIVAGGAFGIIGAVIDASATRKLKAAVDHYNTAFGLFDDRFGSARLALDFRMRPVGGNQTVLFGLNFTF